MLGSCKYFPKNNLVLITLFFLNTLIEWNAGAVTACGWDINDQISMPDGRWEVFLKVSSCSAIDGGAMEVIANNKASLSNITLVKFHRTYPVTISLSDNSVILSVPNMVDLKQEADSFGDYHLNIEFQPRDDPEERRQYVFWLHNPSDPRAMRWFENLIAGQRSEQR